MYKRLIIVYVFCMLLMITVVVLNGCLSYEKIGYDTIDFTVCTEPLVNIGDECCLDRNLDDICDYEQDDRIDARDIRASDGYEEKKDTMIITTGTIDNQSEDNMVVCTDSCRKDSCKGNVFYECKMQQDGCTALVKVGKVLGKCNIECFDDEDLSLIHI